MVWLYCCERNHLKSSDLKQPFDYTHWSQSCESGIPPVSNQNGLSLLFPLTGYQPGKRPDWENLKTRNHQEILISVPYTHYDSVHADGVRGGPLTHVNAADLRTPPWGGRAGRHNVFWVLLHEKNFTLTLIIISFIYNVSLHTNCF